VSSDSSHPLRFSLLDLVPIRQGGDAAEALRHSIDLAQYAERWGYHRFWLAEHHNMAGIASAATSVIIGQIGTATSTIRIGSGGIMLPNHAPLAIAEQFGTLESLFPGRIDLGLGRAPGGDQAVMRALRRGLGSSGQTFPDDVLELQSYFRSEKGNTGVQAVPGAGLNVPLYILGSSTFGAQFAAHMGLPYAFASHFAPRDLPQAIRLYRANFKPSAQLSEPYVIVAVSAFVAETDEAAKRLFTTLQQQFLNLIRGVPGKVPPPVENIEALWQPHEEAHLAEMTRYALVGSDETVARRLEEVIGETGADEIIATAQIHEHADRLESFRRFAKIARNR
jgi:luciferase family oxidoreductase group 1